MGNALTAAQSRGRRKSDVGIQGERPLWSNPGGRDGVLREQEDLLVFVWRCGGDPGADRA